MVTAGDLAQKWNKLRPASGILGDLGLVFGVTSALAEGVELSDHFKQGDFSAAAGDFRDANLSLLSTTKAGGPFALAGSLALKLQKMTQEGMSLAREVRREAEALQRRMELYDLWKEKYSELSALYNKCCKREL